jgi:hypothetical protein
MKTVDGNSCPRSSERCPPSIGTLSGFNRNRCPQSSESANTAIHVILDNLNTHKPKNDRWLKRHPNVHFHFTPTRASWLN